MKCLNGHVSYRFQVRKLSNFKVQTYEASV